MKKVILGIAICAMAFSVSAKDVDAEKVVQDSLFDGIYAGLGIGGSFFKTTGGIPEIGFDLDKDMEADRFMGSAVIGTGKVINNVYGGFELLFDVMKNKKHDWTPSDTPAASRSIEMKGFIPQFNVKAGYSFTHDTVIYGKIGCAWSKVNATQPIVGKDKANTTKNRSKTKASIILGVGAEKIFSNRFSTSLEVDYNFGGSHDYHVDAVEEVKGEGGNITTPASDAVDKNLRWSKGWSIRALAKYNVKI